ncbi:protein XRI1-like isoform X2 [Cornus florida]|uniref:protein XRI1-like isoform X2 n=1 Tax=Cornus florida TaxID=4283 RepID=UPI00289F091C|nr:protein XRI1-like isoform X2 [Cornus florida]
MDYNNDNEMWDWQGEDYCLPKGTTNLDMSQCIWDGVSQNGDLSYIFDETTPIKECGDMAYHVTDSENMNKESGQCRETSSQIKRRRMLQFDDQILDIPICNEEMSSTFLKSKERDDSIEGALSDMSQWVSGFAEVSASGYKGPDQSSEGWLDCLNDAEMQFSPDDMNLSEASDVQIDITEFCNNTTEYDANMVQERPSRTRRNGVFKGRKSYIRTPTKLASSVAYPFAFVKPCGVHGDVTLKDINQKIRTPPPSTLKQSKEDPSSFPTSAFSGKPVVGKTKIRTEGGKGCITIMRTKG